ncbi:MAG: MotA/TolQ/ExbB proton channel family protein [Pirellulales bacterium]|nr:MotA/TolQ/ExbB proton channel family protein [Pirellulales bacterium]
MSRTLTLTRISNALLASPIVWGGLACLGFYAILGQPTLKNPLVGRYFESHPVEYITTALFFIGLAALGMKVIDIVLQNISLGLPLLEAIPAGGQPVEDAPQLLRQLVNVSLPLRRGYRFRRIYEAVEYVRRKGTADSLDDQLRFLAEEDYGRMDSGYAFARIIIWAIPILGFLGTVIGITLAIGKLSPQQLEESLPTVMSGLSVAFDTTGLALSLTIPLMFAKFFVEQFETGLLIRVDARISEELIGRFQQHGAAGDPNVAMIRRSLDAVVMATETLTNRQAQIWKKTIDDAHERWMSLTSSAGSVVEAALAEAVAGSIERHARVLQTGLEHHAVELLDGMTRQADVVNESTELLSASVAQCSEKLESSIAKTAVQFSDSIADIVHQVETSLQEMNHELARVVAEHREAVIAGEQALAGENHRYLSEVQIAIVEAAAQAVAQQEQLVRQGEVLLKVVDATGQVKRLEEILNQNLAALASSHHFEQTVMSLAAAVQLLSMKMDPIQASNDRVQLDDIDLQPPMAA